MRRAEIRFSPWRSPLACAENLLKIDRRSGLFRVSMHGTPTHLGERTRLVEVSREAMRDALHGSRWVPGVWGQFKAIVGPMITEI